MPFVALNSGAYQSRSLIAAAQRCLNLYTEPTPAAEGEPFQVTHYCCPGLTLEKTAPADICRCLYQAGNGDLWACYGQQILYLDASNLWHVVGTLTPSAPSDATPRTTPVSMADDGTTILIADGSVDGWTANVLTHDGFARIDPSAPGYEGWYGATFVTYQDTFFIANKPGTPIFYVSGSEATTFDALDFASKVGQADNLVAAISVHRNLWLIGTTSYEIWINNGGDGTSAGSFPFSIYPEAFGNWGCAAPYSIAVIMNQIFYLSQDKFGRGLVMRGDKLAANRISTFAIEQAIGTYDRIDDAIGYTYQQRGHVFYVLTFPSALGSRGATWCYDDSTGEWHERAYIDGNGIEYRHLSNAAASAYGKVYVGDWRNGSLYSFDLDNYTDAGQPIKRLRSFPHQIDLVANRRVMFQQLIAQMQVGAAGEAGPAETLVDCTFDAPNNTLLQDYHNINSFGANFTKIDSVNAVIIGDALIGQTAGDVLYQVAGTPNTPNYTIRYKVQPTDYGSVATDGTIISLIGRANPSYLGYQGSVYSDGAQYLASLTVGAGSPIAVPLGTIASGYYELFLTMQSTAITLSVYRSVDGNWLTAAGTWAGSSSTAIAISDATYAGPGLVLVGGNWGA